MKNIWNSKHKPVTFQSETSLLEEKGVKGTAVKGMIHRLSGDMCSHMAITILGGGGSQGTADESPEICSPDEKVCSPVVTKRGPPRGLSFS